MAIRDGTAPKVPRVVASCHSCLAWGLTYCQGLCMACYNFAGVNTTMGACGACGRTERLKREYCRLCWCQAALERPSGPNTQLAPYVKVVRQHQLFFAGMSARQAAPRAFPRRYGTKGRPLKVPPPVVGRPSTTWIQPALFDDAVARPYRWGRIDLRCGPAPLNPWLSWALHLAHVMAESRGFDPGKLRTLNRSLVMVLADHVDGEMIRASDFEEVLHLHRASVQHVSEILSSMGILDDHRSPNFETWLAGKLESLSPGIAPDVERWILALRYGTPRRRPRAGAALSYLYAAHPALIQWSTEHDHLREITPVDVLAYADTLVGRQRQIALVALRSLFAWAKKEGVVFANPAGRIRVGRIDDLVWQSLSPEEIARTVAASTTARARLVIALATIHAARSGAIRALQLDDVDVANRRLTIAGRSRPLDDLTRRLLIEWLDHRREQWPNTANCHVIISRESAFNLGPVSQPHIARALRGLPATLERLRIDRQLEEALVHGADPLHLVAVFGISDAAAIRYAVNARQLLERPHESLPLDSLRTRASAERGKLSERLGSS